MLKPMPVQAPLTAWSDQAISAESLQHQIPPCALATGRQALGPKLPQPQFFIELGGQPARAPLARVAQLQFGKFDPDDVGLVQLDRTIFRKQSHRARQGLTMLKNFDGLL